MIEEYLEQDAGTTGEESERQCHVKSIGRHARVPLPMEKLIESFY